MATKRGMTYAASGVDIDAGDRMVRMIRQHMTRTYGPRVIELHGGFAGLFRLDYREDKEKLLRRNYSDPVLVACTDGVGTKVILAAEMGVYDTVGIDLVAMNVNDMLTLGAEPLIFLDYLAVHKLEPDQGVAMVKGVADGCVESGCALLGGETAEMRDVYKPGDFDMAGFAVGVVERRRIIDGKKVEVGNVVLGLASSGIHSNGYSLVRAIVREKKLKLDRIYPELDAGRTLGQVLLEPTRIYVRSISALLKTYRVKRVITAMAHITGGGLVGNLDRVIGSDKDACISRKSWPLPPVFKFLKKHGHISQKEMDRVFNQGIGYCVVVKKAFAQAVQERLEKSGETVYRLGSIVPGTGKVRMS